MSTSQNAIASARLTPISTSPTLFLDTWTGTADARDALILATVQASAHTRGHATTHRRALHAKARYITGITHFRRLCLSDLRQAFLDDRAHGTRHAKNHRRTWLALFRYFAEHQGITQHLQIIALDRQGNYACNLTDPLPRQADWRKLVRLAQEFGITEKALTALWQSQQAGQRSA